MGCGMDGLARAVRRTVPGPLLATVLLAAAPGAPADAAPLRIAAPADGALVTTPSATLAVRTSSSSLRGWLDGRAVTFGAARKGTRRAVVGGLRPGVHRFEAKLGGERASSRFVVGRAAPGLLTVRTVRVGGPAAPVEVRVSAPGDLELRATVNGRPETRAFRSLGKGVWRARLGADGGVRRGANVLRVVAFSESGRQDAETRTFTVAAKGPLAGADAPATLFTDQPITLDGSDTLPSCGGDPAFSWQVTTAPDGADPSLSGATTASPTLTADVPGHYELRLTASESCDGGANGTDTVDLDVRPDDPPIGVAINTRGTNNEILVDGQVVKATGFNPGRLSYALIDRQTRAIEQSGTLPGDSSAVSTLTTLVAGLTDPNRHMLVVNAPNGFPGGSAVLGPLWTKLGGAPFNDTDKAAVDGGKATSIIGIPGSPAGSAYINAGGTALGQPGALVGYLQLNNPNLLETSSGRYGFVFTDVADFDTQVPNAADDNTIRVGSTTSSVDMKDFDEGGFQVVVADARSLQVLSNDLYRINTVPGQIDEAEQRRMISDLAKVTSGQLAFVQSVGQTDPTYTGPTWDSIARALARLGGTRELFNEVSAKTGYALVGAPGLPVPVAEGVSPPGPAPVRLRGALQRSANAGFVPLMTSQTSGVNAELLEIVAQPPEAWPASTTPGEKAANRFVADKLDLLPGRDVRDNYFLNWNITWNVRDLDRAQFPGGDADFTATDLANVKAALADEFGWVNKVHEYIRNQQSPFTPGVSTYLDLQTISNTIANAVKPPDNAAALQPFELFAGFTGVAGALTEVELEEEVLSGIGTAMTVSGKLADRQGSAALFDQVQVATSRLYPELANRYAAAKESLVVAGLMIVSDHGKLRTVARKVTSDPNWIWPASPTGINTAMRKAAKRLFVETLMPIAYRLWNVTPAPNADAWYCYYKSQDPHVKPPINVNVFARAPASAQYKLIQGFNEDEDITPKYTLMTLGVPSPYFRVSRSADPPDASLTDPFFKPLDDDPDSNNLGLHPATFAKSFTWVNPPVGYGDKCPG
jgi:hypothetical protein